MQTVIWFIIMLVAALFSLSILRAVMIRSNTPGITANQAPATGDIDSAADHLATAVTFPTIAHHDDTTDDGRPFLQLHTFLEETYPNIHTQLDRIDTGEPMNLVFRWQGKHQDTAPALLMAHQDVVPVNEEDDWSYPPFAKTRRDGFVWGRGSFDAKGQLIAILEAVEALLGRNFTPERTWYLAFGCDEEIRGTRGAQAIVNHFLNEGLRFAFVLDEGGVVAKGFVPGITTPIAVIGIAEKGDLNLKLRCTKDGGHSSSPQNPTAVGTLARAIRRIETKRNRARISPPVRMLLDTLGRHAPLHLAIPLLNLWLYEPLVIALLGSIPTMNALVRDTMAVTMVEGSQAENVIAKTATAVVNIRTLPEESTERTIARIERIVHDKDVEISIISDSIRSRASSLDGEGFKLISKVIEETFFAVPTPYLMTGGTDALHYEAVSDHVYRFTPAEMGTGELKRMHNVDERFSEENLGKAIRFYTTLITQDSPQVF